MQMLCWVFRSETQVTDLPSYWGLTTCCPLHLIFSILKEKTGTGCNCYCILTTCISKLDQCGNLLLARCKIASLQVLQLFPKFLHFLKYHTGYYACFPCYIIEFKHVFEPRMVTRDEQFACQDSSVSQIFNVIISNGGKMLSNMKMVVTMQVKRENSSLPVAFCGFRCLQDTIA